MITKTKCANNKRLKIRMQQKYIDISVKINI